MGRDQVLNSERLTRADPIGLTRPSSAALQWWLLAIALLAAVPRLYLGATQYIEYDGYWHIFVASQDNWRQFYEEYASNFHPPLFYLLLKVAIWFGHTALAYRAISLITGIAAVFIMGKIAERLCCYFYTLLVTALAYGLALPAIIISCEVRSYMLSVFFILVSFYYFLDFLEGPNATVRARVWFALNAALAGLSHYGAFLYICACAVTAMLFDLTLFRRNLWKRLLHDTVTFVAIAVVLAPVYVSHGEPHAGIAEHLRAYYWPSSNESLWVFLAQNTHHLLNLFSPFPIANGMGLSLICGALTVAGVSLVYLIRRVAQSENFRSAATLVVGGLLFLLIVAGGVLGKYPYGGELRQQFFLFPFAILCGGILFDRITGTLNRSMALTIAVSACLAIIASSTYAFAEYPKSSTELGTMQMQSFRREFPAPRVVYVDQFNLINFFIHYHDWHWSYISRCPAAPAISIYRLSNKTTSFFVFRDWSRWNPDLTDPGVFSQLADCIREQHLPSVTTFYMRQETAPIPVQKEPELASRIINLASAESLCVSKLRIQGVRIYASLQPGACRADIPAMNPCSKCDDTNWNIVYSGNWLRGEFDPAWNATLTYTDNPGASARFSFDGTELHYCYTRAYNRGTAAITIDGISKGEVDLYSPTIQWQTCSAFGSLPSGQHTVEIRATGRHDPMSTGSYIDIDALEGR